METSISPAEASAIAWRYEPRSTGQSQTDVGHVVASSVIRGYWNGRAGSYARSVEKEITASAEDAWWQVFREYLDIEPRPSSRPFRILDVGTGPGYFSLLFAQMGCEVHGVDLSPLMIERASRMTAGFDGVVDLRVADAMALPFRDKTFDAVVTRNLTWTLPNPLGAYKEWHRVLKDGGTLLNFDANWYTYLIDDDLRVRRDGDQADSSVLDGEGQATVSQCEACEKIALTMPLTYEVRPAWDEQALREAGFTATMSNPDIWKRVWNTGEKIFYAATPLFMVGGIR